MNDAKLVDAVGFDLDNTLYCQTPAITQKIQEYIISRASVLLQRPLEQVQREYTRIYTQLQSGRRTLEALGISEAQALVQDALEHADITSLLQRDERFVSLFQRLQTSYRLFLLTGSQEQTAHNKLRALGISPTAFNLSLYAGARYERHDGSAFRHVAQVFGVPLTRLFFVGDREKVDILPAKQLGVKTAIINASSPHADYQLTTLYDLEGILLT